MTVEKIQVPRFRLSRVPQGRLHEALDANQLIIGPHLETFEGRVAEMLDFPYCLATINGFSALHLALNISGLAGNTLVVPSVSSCFAVLHAATVARCNVLFCDLDENGRVNPEAVRKIAATEPVKGVLAPSLFGIPAPVKELKRLGFILIEDAAQGFYNLCAQYSRADVVTLSFYPSKMMNAIDGGALLSRNKQWMEEARDQVYYGHQQYDDNLQRYNYRLSNLHAAVGLDSLDAAQETKRKIRQVNVLYRETYSRFSGVRMIGEPKDADLVSRFVIELPSQKLANEFHAGMREAGVGSGRELLILAGPEFKSRFPVARRLVEQTVSLPLFPDISDDEVQHVVEVGSKVLRRIGL